MADRSHNAQSAKSPGSDAYHHGDLRNALLAAAGDLLEEVGPERLSLREVARRCGVSQTAPYRHFDTRHALLVALAADAFRAFAGRMKSEAEGVDDPPARLRALGRAYLAFAIANPAKLRLMFGPQSPSKDSSAELQEAAREAFALIHDATEARLAQPGTRKMDLEQATLGAWAIVHGLASLAIDMPLPPGLEDEARRSELADTLMDIYQRGLDAT